MRNGWVQDLSIQLRDNSLHPTQRDSGGDDLHQINTIFKTISLLGNLEFLTLSALARGALLGQEDGLDVGQNSALGDGDSGQQFVQLFVVADSELEIRI